MLVQDTHRLAASRKQRDALDASNQVIGKRRHAKRQFKDYYVGDESTSRQKSESNPDGVAIGEAMAPDLEPPKRARSPNRSSSMSKGANPVPNEMVVKESVVKEIVHNGRGARGSSKANPYAKSYGKESAGNNKAGAASGAAHKVKENGHSTHKGGQQKGGSSNTKMSAAEMLAANTRGLNDTNEEVDTEHEAGETFWRSLIPCFRLICPEDAKALKPKVTQQSPVICAEFSCRVQKKIRCFGSVSSGHITH